MIPVKGDDNIFTVKHYNKFCSYIKQSVFMDVLPIIISELNKYGDILIVGGCIKDIVFFDREPKDYDIVVVTEQKISNISLPSQLNITCVKNSFGGLKLKYKGIQLDIWATPTLAICEKNTFIQTNFDGLYINISKRYFSSTLFNSAIKNETIEILNDTFIHPQHSRNQERIINQKLQLDKIIKK